MTMTVDERVPRTRGDEPQIDFMRRLAGDEFPAHAGMNLLASNCRWCGLQSSPHTRG